MPLCQLKTSKEQEIDLVTKIRAVAMRNGLPKDRPELFLLSLKIACDFIDNLDNDDFEAVTNLKK